MVGGGSQRLRPREDPLPDPPPLRGRGRPYPTRASKTRFDKTGAKGRPPPRRPPAPFRRLSMNLRPPLEETRLRIISACFRLVKRLLRLYIPSPLLAGLGFHVVRASLRMTPLGVRMMLTGLPLVVTRWRVLHRGARLRPRVCGC
jgi:hypothetical protein